MIIQIWIRRQFECYLTKKFLNSIDDFIAPIEMACKQILKTPNLQNHVYQNPGWP